jgi:hypothetical protein
MRDARTPDETGRYIINTYTGLVTAGKEKFQVYPFVSRWPKSAATW